MKRKQTSKNLSKAFILIGIMALPIISKAQLKVSGLVFGDYAYKLQSDSIAYKGRKNTAEYNNLAKNYDGFNMRRAYLSFDYDINSRVHVSATLAHESTTPTGGLEILPDNNQALYLKYFELRYKDVFKGTDLILGQQHTPTFCTTNGSEPIWQYRSVERTITDFRRLASSTDFGVGLEGKYFNGKLGYNLLYANNLGAKVDETLPTSTSNARRLYADVWYKFLNHFEVQLYGDYSAYNYNWDSTGKKFQTTSSMYKLFVAYVVPKAAIGVEAFQQTNTYAANDINNNTIATGYQFISSKTASLADLRNTTPQGISVFAHAILIQGDTSAAAKRIGKMQDNQLGGVLSVFARYDYFNPDGNMTDALAVNKKNGSSYQSTESFITAGLDWQINKSVHIMPNVWIDNFTQKDDQSISHYAAKNSSDVVARISLFYWFY